MTFYRHIVQYFFTFFLIIVMIQGCAKKPYLDLTYQLPAPSASQKGNEVCLIVKDVRQNQELFGNAAKKEFKDFSGLFDLTVVSIDKKQLHLGTYELENLFQKTLEKRMQNMGIKVLKECSNQKPVMHVSIRTFKIDLVHRKWKADVAYDASLTRDSKKKINETVAGKAERVKIMGSKAAQTVVGELFSDMVNRLDINRLFDQSIL